MLPFLASVAALPITQAFVGAFIILERQRECLSVDELLSAFFNAWSRFHKQRTALGVSDFGRAVVLLEVINDAVNQGIG